MATVIYNEQKIIPAPLVNISRNYQKSGNGEIIGQTFTIVLTGSIIAWMGSPNSSGIFWGASGYPPDEVVSSENRLGAIQRKQEALRYLFSIEGKSFEIQSSIDDEAVRCNPRLLDISFTEGIWYERCEYTITLETDELYGGPFDQPNTFTQYISDASEEWSIDTNEESAEGLGIPKTYTMTHSISANGKRFYDETGTLVKQPWQYAKDFVLTKIGIDNSIFASSGVNNLPSYYHGYNHVRNENINEQGGSYSVTENWVLASGTATEDFTVQTTTNLDSPYESVNIEGTVTGYDNRNADLSIITNKWDNAETKFTSVQNLTFIRAQQFSGLLLNSEPMSETIGRNPIQGTIQYAYEYDTRPSNFVDGARSESISIHDAIGGELHAEVFVLGRGSRGLGPVLQDLDAKPANTRSLNIELVMETLPNETSLSTLLNYPADTIRNNIQVVIDAANPENAGLVVNGINIQEQPQEDWNIKDFRYNYSTKWTYE